MTEGTSTPQPEPVFRELLERVLGGEPLTRAEARWALGQMMDAAWAPARSAALLIALRARGETPDEIAGMAELMRERALTVDLSGTDAIDTCGTGGDGADTFNISTAAALVAAGAGVCIAKHGNRAVSSRAGSADVLEALGVRIDGGVELAQRMLAEAGFAFLFAPRHHQAMKNLAGVRRELGVRTVMNVLGPLANPAGVRRQIVGVFSPELVERLAGALLALDTEAALVVHGHDGLDEISLSAPTTVAVLRRGAITIEEWDPGMLGLDSAGPDAFRGGSAEDNARIIGGVLAGERGPARDIVVANAAAALLIADRAGDLREGVAQAREAIDSGKALGVLDTLRALSAGG
jgi:anthranilate phosphoribosyltransferase